MTDKEALKVLESWLRLAYQNADGTDEDSAELYEALKTTLALINRQQSEIDRLKEKNNRFADISKMYSEIKSEAIKEFAKQVEIKFYYHFDEMIPSIMADEIDNLVKEMVGE